MDVKKLHDRKYVLHPYEIRELQTLCYEYGNSAAPFDAFFNDIDKNEDFRFDRNSAFQDLWLILLEFIDAKKKARGMEILKNCLVGEYQLINDADTNNYFKTPYRLRIYLNEYEYNEWYLRNEEEYNSLKGALKDNV